MNTPSGGLYQNISGIAFSSNSSDTFISVQALFVTPDDTLWILDTGRPSTNEKNMLTMPYALPGGPKLVAINLTSNTVQQTYTFPSSVHYPDSYMNDLRCMFFRIYLAPAVLLFQSRDIFLQSRVFGGLDPLPLRKFGVLGVSIYR